MSEYRCDFEGQEWYRKVGLRELLGYELAARELNVAEVRRTPEGWNMSGDNVVVRIAQTYDSMKLPLQDLNEAVASELAYSLWIRRRDTHAYNRAYTKEVPVFFDHSVAFPQEPSPYPVTEFLESDGDAGYASRWRVIVPKAGFDVTTENVRTLNKESDCAIHIVEDYDSFLTCFRRWIRHFEERDLTQLEQQVADVLPQDQVKPIAEKLRQWQSELSEGADRLEDILFRPLPNAAR